jgi:hypothetical protein
MRKTIDQEVELLEKACDAAFGEARREWETARAGSSKSSDQAFFAQYLHKEHMGILALLRATNLRLRRIEARLAGESIEAVAQEHEALGAFAEFAETTEVKRSR